MENSKERVTNMVEHPNHYNQGGIECSEVMKAFYGIADYKAFLRCSSLKYQMRHKLKGSSLQDLKKAHNMLGELIELEECKDEDTFD